MLEKIKEILEFWFENKHLWWASDPEFDQLIKDRFEDILLKARAGECDPWLEMPHSCLAYIILLDQFSRNMYRNTALAFAQDHLALKACQHGLENKLDKEFNLFEKQFFYMPLEHSEEIENQKLCLALMKQLENEARTHHPENLKEMEQAFEYAKKHFDIIANFGRFPHRNEILDRDSTQDEILFLSLPNNLF